MRMQIRLTPKAATDIVVMVMVMTAAVMMAAAEPGATRAGMVAEPVVTRAGIPVATRAGIPVATRAGTAEGLLRDVAQLTQVLALEEPGTNQYEIFI